MGAGSDGATGGLRSRPWRPDPRLYPCAALAVLGGGYLSSPQPAAGLALVALGTTLLLLPLPGRRARGLALLAAVLLAAGGRQAAQSPVPGAWLPGTEGRFRGLVAADPRLGVTGPRLLVDLSARAADPAGPWEPLQGRVYLAAQGWPEPPPARGDAVVFRARLRPPRGFRNPGSAGFASYLRRLGVGARASARWPGALLAAPPNPAQAPLLTWRRRTSAAIAAAVPGPPGEILRALALGDRSGLRPTTNDAFRAAGTAHLLAVSGLHLGILALVAGLPLSWALARLPAVSLRVPARAAAAALTLPVLTAYAALAGFQTSTLRALALVTLLLAAGAGSRRTSPLLVLAACALALALWDPALLADPGLHLSIAALAGLYWMAPRLQARLVPNPGPLEQQLAARQQGPRWGHRLRRTAGALVATSVAASLATAPVSAYHFGAAPTLGLVLNAVAIPLVGFVTLPLALLGVACHGPLPALATAAWSLAALPVDAVMTLQGHLLDWLPPLHWAPLETLAGCLAAGLALVALGLTLEHGLRYRGAWVCALGAAAGLVLPPAAAALHGCFDTTTRYWVFDVGHGQAVAVRTPGPDWVVVDAGGFAASSFDVGERVVVPALRELGARRLALAISTHPHPDHVGGFPALLEWGRPAQVWLPRSYRGDDRYAATLAAATRHGIPVRWVDDSGLRARLGTTQVLARSFGGRSENDRSLAVLFRAPDGDLLVPGDLEEGGQRRLVADPELARGHTLVAPHHGSGHTLWQGLVPKLAPRQVLISSGSADADSTRELAEQCRAAGVAVLDTRTHGCLTGRLGGPASGLDTPAKPAAGLR